MLYSAEEVFEYVEQEDVKFIRLAFCDVTGRQKNISIMPEELERAFSYGISLMPPPLQASAARWGRICFCIPFHPH